MTQKAKGPAEAATSPDHGSIPLTPPKDQKMNNFNPSTTTTTSTRGETILLVPRTDIIKVIDKLGETESFIEAVFMAAAALEDRDQVAVFQRLADVAKEQVIHAQGLLNAIHEEGEQ